LNTNIVYMKRKIISILKLVLIFFGFSTVLKSQPEYFQRIYNPLPGSDTYFYDAVYAGNSNFVLTGSVQSSTGGLYLLMINKYGAPLWDKIIPGSRGRTVIKKNNKFIVSGESDSLFTIAFDSSGNLVWSRKYPQLNITIADMINTSDNGFAACGISGYDFGIIVKFDSTGNLMWSKLFPESYAAGFSKLIEHRNEFYLISNNNDSLSAAVNPLIVKMDSQGNLLSQKIYNFAGFSIVCRDLIINNNFIGIFCDRFHISTQKSRNFVIRTDLNLNLIDTLTIPSINGGIYNDHLENVTGFKNNTYIVQSYISDSSHNQFKLLDSNFHLLRFKNVSSPSMLNGLISTSDNSILSIGIYDAEQLIDDYGYVNKMDSNFSTSSNVISVKENKITLKDFSLSQNYPNPFNPSTKISYSLKKSSDIELKLFDATGRFVKILHSGYKSAGNYEMNFTSDGLSSGVYFISLFSDGILADTKKAILLK